VPGRGLRDKERSDPRPTLLECGVGGQVDENSPGGGCLKLVAAKKKMLKKGKKNTKAKGKTKHK
jgi:hypothetical protein